MTAKADGNRNGNRYEPRVLASEEKAKEIRICFGHENEACPSFESKSRETPGEGFGLAPQQRIRNSGIQFASWGVEITPGFAQCRDDGGVRRQFEREWFGVGPADPIAESGIDQRQRRSGGNGRRSIG